MYVYTKISLVYNKSHKKLTTDNDKLTEKLSMGHVKYWLITYMIRPKLSCEIPLKIDATYLKKTKRNFRYIFR